MFTERGFNVGSDNNVGRTRIFEWNGSTWNQLGSEILGVDKLDNDGYFVSMDGDGDRIAISNVRTNSSAGRVRIFHLEGGDWVLQETFFGEAAGDRFGEEISFSDDGSRLVVSATLHDAGGTNNSGKVYVYDFLGGAWTLTNTLSETAEDSGYGRSLSISGSGNTIVVGAHKADNALGEDSGEAYVYDYIGTDWIQRGDALSGLMEGDKFGSSVSIDSSTNRVTVSAEENNPDTGGYVLIYDWNGLSWEVLGDGLLGDLELEGFGQSLDIAADGETLIVGAPDRNLATGQVTVLPLQIVRLPTP